MRKPVEHYVVKPNRTQGDWYYEYSNGSNINGCNCCKDTDKLSISIDSLRAALQQLQNSVQNITPGNIDPEQLSSMIESAVSNHLQQSDSITSIINQIIDDKNFGQINIEVRDKVLYITTNN